MKCYTHGAYDSMKLFYEEDGFNINDLSNTMILITTAIICK